jgi:sugar lactone lactonase YvrE
VGQSYIPPIVPTAAITLYTSSAVISPGRVAVDKAGNVFYVAVGSGSTLMEIPAATQTGSNAAPVTLITGIGQYNAKAVVVDALGNLWVTTGNQESAVAPGSSSTDYISLVEIPAANGIPNTSLAGAGGTTLNKADAAHCTSGGTALCTVLNYKLNDAGGVIAGPQVLDFTIDTSGNITYVDIGDNNLPSGKARVASSNVYNGNGAVLATVTQDYSGQVAVDGAGKVYYCSPGASTVSLVSNSTLLTVGTTGTISAAMVLSPTGISSDSFGNLYIAGGGQLSEVPFEATALNFSDEFGVISGLTNSISNGGSLDQNGNYYYSYNSSSATKVVQLQINGYNFGSVPVGSIVNSSSTPAAASLSLFDNVANAGVSSYFPTGSPTSNTTSLYLQSFPYSGTKSFTSGTAFTVGSVSTITMNFQPIHPGLLKGSFTPRINGADVTSINLQGAGAGPEALLSPGTPSAVFTMAGTKTINAPQGLAIDTYGDIFVADTGNGTVDADCLSTTSQSEDGTGGNTSNSFCSLATYTNAITQLGTGFISPVAIALDGAESLYVVDSAATGTPVTMINGQSLAATKLISASTTFGGTALSSPMGIAVDGYTNIYVADTGNSRIVEAHQFGATETDNVVYIPSTVTFGSVKLKSPTGLAVDQNQNLYIADTGNNRIVEYSSTGVASVIGTGSIALSSPYAVAVYPSGQLVVTDSANGAVLLNGSSSQVLSFGNTFTATGAKGVALDATGNIYVSNTVGDQILELNVTSLPAISFPNTNVAAISPLNSETVIDEGNASLIFSALAPSNNNFAIDSSSTCTSTTTVAAGGSCTVVTKFTPQSVGPLTGSVTLTDNQLAYTLNASPPSNGENEIATFGTSGTQALSLSGTATSQGAPQTINFVSLTSPITYTVTPIPLSATATSGLPVSFSVVSGPGTVSGSSLTVTGVGTVLIAANQPGSTNFSAAPQVTQSLVVNQASQSITFAPATPVTYTATPIALSATATSGLAVSFTLVSGPATLSGSTLTLTGLGTVVIAANQAGNANYLPAPSVQKNIVVNPIGVVATPVFSLAGGTYNAAYVSTLTLTDSTAGAAIYFTTNGSTPTTSSTLYAGSVAASGITLSGNETVQAIAVLTGYTPSAVASAAYTVDTASEALSPTITPSSLTLQPGQSGTINITVTPQNGMNTTISFGCTGLPVGASCSFNPASVATGPSQAAVSTVLTVTAPATTAAANPHSRNMLAGTTLAMTFLTWGWRRRRSMRLEMRLGLLFVLAAICTGALSGCGSSSSNQTSTVTVAISGDSVRDSVTFTLTVP